MQQSISVERRKTVIINERHHKTFAKTIGEWSDHILGI
jgi:hypothetical protein